MADVLDVQDQNEGQMQVEEHDVRQAWSQA
jgi:hypothetical protein